MDKKELLINFINKIQKKKLLTAFISELFNYDGFHDYNYLFRINSEDDLVIIDIYDNVSSNRFNRYIFVFKNGEYSFKTIEEGNVFVTKIYIDNIQDDSIKLHKFAFLFRLDYSEMHDYAKTFLSNKFVMILDSLI